ncbi:MAG: hypothetical protein NZ108_07420, partial [Bacteroidia bacterium]|nr:hypothetical protein [Bacteroidia bacterium]
MKRLLAFLFIAIIFSRVGFSQTLTAPPQPIRTPTTSTFAFYNATIIIAPGKKIEKGTLIIQDGRIIAVGNNLPVPRDAKLVDLQGLWVYPGFIDAYSGYGLKTEESTKTRWWEDNDQAKSNRTGPYYWNQAVRPEESLAEKFVYDSSKAEQ